MGDQLNGGSVDCLDIHSRVIQVKNTNDNDDDFNTVYCCTCIRGHFMKIHIVTPSYCSCLKNRSVWVKGAKLEA